MAAARIVWNANNLDFPEPLLSDFVAKPHSNRAFAYSDGNVSSVALKSIFWEGRIVLDKFTDAQFEADLHAWFSWAVQGKQYSVARDSSDVVNTTLTQAQSAGDGVLKVASGTGITVGRRYLLRNVATREEEIVTVSAIAAPDVTLDGALWFPHEVGDVLRTQHYLPKVVSLDDDFPVVENKTLTWTFDHRFREDAA